jgi:hypothetical protein
VYKHEFSGSTYQHLVCNQHMKNIANVYSTYNKLRDVCHIYKIMFVMCIIIFVHYDDDGDDVRAFQLVTYAAL